MLSCESGRLELIEAVKKIDFVVCADVNMNDSAQWADIVLPVPHAFEMQDFDPVCSVPFPAYYPERASSRCTNARPTSRSCAS